MMYQLKKHTGGKLGSWEFSGGSGNVAVLASIALSGKEPASYRITTQDDVVLVEITPFSISLTTAGVEEGIDCKKLLHEIRFTSW